MPAPAGSESRWDARIARARALASASPAAAEVLSFYAALAEYQKKLAAGRSLHLSSSVDVNRVLDAIPEFLSWLQRMGPPPLADATGAIRRIDRHRWRHLVESHTSGETLETEDADVTMTFILEALLQPLEEELAIARAEAVNRPARTAGSDVSSRCPFCNRLPVVGVLREEGQGGKRTLLCRLCLTEHAFLRGICPACSEHKFDALPVYTADRFAHVRVDACDRCRTYLKTVDLTKDGSAVPIVDDLATVSLDLWARERGYIRLAPNLLRL
jgi:FdhE protein